MTLTIKDTPAANYPGKQGAPSQNSQNKPGETSRSNPVCLEVSVTIRSLPNDAAGLTKPICEEVRTVIVFDNGAVLRCAENLPIGLTLTLSNPNGREVVCRVVGGRNLQSIKGYVEVQFVEPINDFWGIHQDVEPAAVAASPAAAPAPREVPLPTPTPAPPRAAAPVKVPSKAKDTHLSGAPTFDDIGGLASTPVSTAPSESIAEPSLSSLEQKTKEPSGYNRSEMTRSTSLANWNPSDLEPATQRQAIPATAESFSSTSATPPSMPPRDFMSKGLMAYEKPHPPSDALNGRKPLIVGAAALALALVGAVVFFMHRNTAPASVTKAVVASQPAGPEPPAANSAPEPISVPQEAAVPATITTQSAVQSVAVEQAQTVATATPIPVVVTSSVNTDLRTESRNVQNSGRNKVAAKQAEPSASRRPAISSLKMSSPSVPLKKLADLSGGPAPMSEIAATEAMGVATPGLLTSAGRTSNPPTPPPSASAPVTPPIKTVREPKLISSTRLVYPQSARQANVHGIVTVYASVDENGNVVSAKALSGPPLLRDAAVDSVKHWKYSPGLLDGKPASLPVTVNVEFRLN
jgi:TonB family protein